MTLQQRTQSMVELGRILAQKNDAFQSVARRAELENPWFDQQHINHMIDAITEHYLDEAKLTQWLAKYQLSDAVHTSEKLGIIMAGNIPLVGFHDLLCGYLAGYPMLIKLSEKDTRLMQYIIDTIESIDSRSADIIQIVERLKAHTRVIATGSDNTARYFEYYFKDVPLLLRKNRNSVAILDGNETKDQLQDLVKDMMLYYGLGCRNVAKVYVPTDYDITQLFELTELYLEYLNHNKYKNNIEYSTALYILNKEEILTNNLLIFRKDESIFSRISCVHYETYDDIKVLETKLRELESSVQCFSSNIVLDLPRMVAIGQCQQPALDDYADGVDTMAFLTND